MSTKHLGANLYQATNFNYLNLKLNRFGRPNPISREKITFFTISLYNKKRSTKEDDDQAKRNQLIAVLYKITPLLEEITRK